jgi:pseudaminic acid biosynthesis-associated methylase
MRQKNEQELFWEGAFGADYTARNQDLSEERLPFFSKLLALMSNVQTVCELGSNRGENLSALQRLRPDLRLTGVEINLAAVERLQAISGVEAVQSSIQDFAPRQQYDLVFTSGVLIHLNPEDLSLVYRKMGELSKRYVLINEYFNPSPVEILYRGNTGKLFKRDFAGEFLDAQDGRFSVVDYGFLWSRLNPAWDNTTWVLMEKRV